MATITKCLVLPLVIAMAVVGCADSKKAKPTGGSGTITTPIYTSPTTPNSGDFTSTPIEPYSDDMIDGGNTVPATPSTPTVTPVVTPAPIDPTPQNGATNEDVLKKLSDLDTRIGRDEEMAQKAFQQLKKNTEEDTWDKISKYGIPIFLGLTALRWLMDGISAASQSGDPLGALLSPQGARYNKEKQDRDRAMLEQETNQKKAEERQAKMIEEKLKGFEAALARATRATEILTQMEAMNKTLQVSIENCGKLNDSIKKDFVTQNRNIEQMLQIVRNQILATLKTEKPSENYEKRLTEWKGKIEDVFKKYRDSVQNTTLDDNSKKQILDGLKAIEEEFKKLPVK